MPYNIALKLAFLEGGITQDAIAHETGIHPSRLSRIVRGYLKPSKEERRLLAKALRRQVSDLFPEDASQAVA